VDVKVSGRDAVAAAAGEYCRAVEAHLCRRNHGHLVRVVGPAFERVCDWAARGVPLRVALAGIDRCLDRFEAKGPRRRPVPVEFCEGDVLDLFDEWRRALGVPLTAVRPTVAAGTEGSERPDAASARRREPLPAHLERAIARLTAARSGAGPLLTTAIDAAVRELDRMRGSAGSLRGEARQLLLTRLAVLDRDLSDAAAAELTPAARASLTREAEGELAPYRARMAPPAYGTALAAATTRLVREHARLPMLELT